MMIPPVPEMASEVDATRWQSFEPFYRALSQTELTPENSRLWLENWSDVSRLVWEAGAMIYIEKSQDTTDNSRESAFLDYINQVSPAVQIADQGLKNRLLALEADSPDFDDLRLVLRNMRNEVDLFREENVPLFTELSKLDNEYDKVTGGMKAAWNGEEKNLNQLGLFLQEKDRNIREKAWRTKMKLWLGSRGTLNQIYADMLDLRQRVAANAGLPDYRAYIFREKARFDYSPEDCLVFHDAIEKVIVPAAERVYAKRKNRMGLDTLRPWDSLVEPGDAPPLKPYQRQEDLIQGTLNVLSQVDPALGRYFSTLAEEDLLDLDTRQGKALGGYCSTLPLRQRPFIFMNGVGTHDNVQTLLHEAGHAFHVFETRSLPLVWQQGAPMEFSEVASMAMELLSAPYLTTEQGGFYSPSEAARARIEHLEGILIFLPYMAVVDAFQHWVYLNPGEAKTSSNCDAAWGHLWDRFMRGVDWSGLEEERVTGWHRKLHIFGVPFYYIEYGMAQVGALQIWRNSLSDRAGAVAAYRKALAWGGTKTLPELYSAAGAEFRFDDNMLIDLADLIEQTILELESQI